MEIIDNLEGFKNNGIVLTVGFFDGVHIGHRFLLNQLAEIAKAEGLQSAVLTFWPHPRIVLNEDYKPKLLNSYEEKFELMKNLPIDFCIRTEFSESFSNYQAYDFMKLVLKEKLNVKHLLIGYDHRFGKNREEGFDDYCVYGKELGIKVTQALPLEENGDTVSSSFIRDLLSVGEVALASEYLGYAYKISGKVVCGQKKGREIGFPTANVAVDQSKCLPKKGVYAASVACGDLSYNAMLYVGNRPTVDSEGDLSVEAHLLEFDGDLYGKDVEIKILGRVRDQRKFDSLQDLKAQIEIDCEEAKKMF